MKHRLFLLIPILAALSCSGPHYSLDGNRLTVEVGTPQDGGARRVRLTAVSDGIIRVEATPDDTFATRKSLVVLPQDGVPAFRVREKGGRVLLETAGATASVDRKGRVRFLGPDGTVRLDEAGKSFSRTEVEGKEGYSYRTWFSSPDDEAFYGLGQQQSLEFNHKGGNEELYQYNTKISLPVILSSRGYGLLWDTYSLSRWGNPAPYAQLGEVLALYDKDGVRGALTGTYTPAEGEPLVQREDSLYYENEWVVANLPKIPLKGASVSYEGFLEAPRTGDYHFILYYAGYQKVSVGGKEVVSERWRAAWNPNSYKFTVHLDKGVKTPLRVDWLPDGDVSYIGLRVAPLLSDREQNQLSFWTEMCPEIDYYYLAGDSKDEVIRNYRLLTGKAPVMPKWVLGFWQSHEHYASQQEILDAAAELRRREIPFDNIVQDWKYWNEDQWGSHEFEASRYPSPERMLDRIHDLHGRYMISVWPKFYTNTAHYQELKRSGYVYPYAEEAGLLDWLGHPQSFYDAYSEGGRKMFWRQMDECLYSRFGRKIDAWWMDASEPNLRDCLPMDYQKALTTPTECGPSTEYFNAYALMNADAIYNGQREVDPDKRVFLLTRNGFPGLQRYSTASWSGDIGSSWLDMRAQMAAGLNYCLSGIPFWGMDIGGFTVPDRFMAAESLYRTTGEVNGDLVEWRELQTRWHQWGAFVPIFRAHGQWPHRELWNIDPDEGETYHGILASMRLRYRLMPYLYSLAGAVWMDDYTLMRALPMDFPDDPAVTDLSDEWMFGPAFLPCPVYTYKARSREVYLPAGPWYDFYTGESLSGPSTFTADAPYDRMPLYVRGGSIVPAGPDMQWSDEKPADPIDLYVYAGRDGAFTLYEDDGLTYGYEKGEFSTVSFTWKDADRTLTVSSRSGSFPGMLSTRTFRVVLVDPSHPVGFSGPGEPEAVVLTYAGDEITVEL